MKCPLGTAATKHGSWHKTSHYAPASPGAYRMTVHPGGTVHWAWWTGKTWSVFASTADQAEMLKDVPFQWASPFWFSGDAVAHPILSRKKVMTPRIGSGRFISTYHSFFGTTVTQLATKPREKVKAKQAWPTPAEYAASKKTQWRSASEKPELPGLYEVKVGWDVKTASWTGKKWSVRGVQDWRGLNTKAHVKLMKNIEIGDSEF